MSMTVITLKPSVWRTLSALVLGIGGIMAAEAATNDGSLWVRAGVLIGVTTFLFVFVWLMFVPIRLEFDRVELTIRYPFRRRCTIPWYELERYSYGRLHFTLQFEGGTFHIFFHAYSGQDWWKLTNFLSTRFPD